MKIDDFLASNLAYKFLNEKAGVGQAVAARAAVTSGLEKASKRI